MHLLQQELRITNRMSGDLTRLVATTAMAVAAEIGPTTPDPTGVKLNAEGDLTAFVSAVITNVISVAVFLGIFSWLRLQYPIIFGDNSLKGISPILPETMFGWLQETLEMSVDEINDRITLDHAMMLEFTHLCMKKKNHHWSAHATFHWADELLLWRTCGS